MNSSPRLFLTLLFAQAVALFGQPAAPAPASAEDPIVLTINGEPVSADEYLMVMHRKTPLVTSHFKQTRDLDDRAGYWSPASGPDGPLAKLRELTLAELVRIKVYQSEAKARGLMKAIDFASFRDAFEKENARRLAAKARNEVIYGPPQYRRDIYYFILFGDVSYKLEHAIAKELEPAITAAEINGFLAAHEKDFKEVPADEARQRAKEVLSLRAAQKKLADLCASAVTEIRPEALARLSPRPDDVATP
jgi:SOS response regulatory protein OraA/RecX